MQSDIILWSQASRSNQSAHPFIQQLLEVFCQRLFKRKDTPKICMADTLALCQTDQSLLQYFVSHSSTPAATLVEYTTLQSFPSLAMQAQARDSSFCVFSRSHFIRRLAIKTVENAWFNRLLLCIILANCVFLAIANPVCDTNIEIQETPECQNNPKWQRVGLHPCLDSPAPICSALQCLFHCSDCSRLASVLHAMTA